MHMECIYKLCLCKNTAVQGKGKFVCFFCFFLYLARLYWISFCLIGRVHTLPNLYLLLCERRFMRFFVNVFYWTEPRIAVQLFALTLAVCMCAHVRLQQHVVSLWLRQWEGRQGSLITESEGTSHPPPLFLTDPKAEWGLLQHTKRHTQTVKCLLREQGIQGGFDIFIIQVFLVFFLSEVPIHSYRGTRGCTMRL